jgi:hypothetical protein
VQCSKLALACGIAGVWLYLATGWRRYDMQTFHRLSLEAALLALPGDLPPTEAREPLGACGYCGSPMHVEGDVLHRVDCNRPVPREDDTPDD